MPLKDNCSENNERKRWKKDKNDDDNKGENRKTAKTKCNTEKYAAVHYLEMHNAYCDADENFLY